MAYQMTGWTVICPKCVQHEMVRPAEAVMKKVRNLKLSELPWQYFHNCSNCGQKIFMKIDVQVVEVKPVDHIDV